MRESTFTSNVPASCPLISQWQLSMSTCTFAMGGWPTTIVQEGNKGIYKQVNLAFYLWNPQGVHNHKCGRSAHCYIFYRRNVLSCQARGVVQRLRTIYYYALATDAQEYRLEQVCAQHNSIMWQLLTAFTCNIFCHGSLLHIWVCCNHRT